MRPSEVAQKGRQNMLRVPYKWIHFPKNIKPNNVVYGRSGLFIQFDNCYILTMLYRLGYGST